MTNSNSIVQRDAKDIKEEVFGERLARKEVEFHRQRSRNIQDKVLDSLIEQARALAAKHFSALNAAKEKDIPSLLKEDYIRLIEAEQIGYLKAYSIIKLAETMLLEVKRHFIPLPIK